MAMEERIQDQPWFRATVDELRQYRTLQGRIRDIEIQLRRDVGPDAKVIANYGITIGAGLNPDEISKLEVELEAKQIRLKRIKNAIETLEQREKEIAELKFIHGYKDREIYESKLPMAKATFYAVYNPAIEKAAKCLGYLEC
jgi:DNA-directed RNA polymerase specialized sigma24 family protein